MKTSNYSENLRHGEDIVISISLWEGAKNINVNASKNVGERSTSVALEYDMSTGARLTEVSDYSAPFDNAFYTALDAHLVKVAAVINDMEDKA